MRKITLVILLIACSELVGCAGTIVPAPKDITFEEAMVQVANGLNKMYDIGKDHPRSGLVPTDVTIDFNIAASATDTGKLTVDTALQGTKVGAEVGSQVQASRGNKITIKFTNLFLTNSKDALIMIKKPEEIKALLELLKASGYEPVIKMQ